MITTSKKKLQAIVQGGRTQSKSNWGLFDKENQPAQSNFITTRQAQGGENDK
jgi:predicted GTPase